MNLSFKLLEVCNINEFKVLDEYSMTKGTQQFLYFQLFTETSCGATRYIPQGVDSNVVMVVLDHIDDFKKIKRIATAPFVGDGSIFRIALSANDCVCYNGMIVKVQETTAPNPMIEYTFNMDTAIRVIPTGNEKRFV